MRDLWTNFKAVRGVKCACQEVPRSELQTRVLEGREEAGDLHPSGIGEHPKDRVGRLAESKGQKKKGEKRLYSGLLRLFL